MFHQLLLMQTWSSALRLSCGLTSFSRPASILAHCLLDHKLVSCIWLLINTVAYRSQRLSIILMQFKLFHLQIKNFSVSLRIFVCRRRRVQYLPPSAERSNRALTDSSETPPCLETETCQMFLSPSLKQACFCSNKPTVEEVSSCGSSLVPVFCCSVLE